MAESAAQRAIPIQRIEQESARDLQLAEVRHCIQTNSWDEAPAGYKAVRNELAVLGKLVLGRAWLVMPKTLSRWAVDLAHERHQGIVKTKMRLRSKVWWPGLDRETEAACLVMSSMCDV